MPFDTECEKCGEYFEVEDWDDEECPHCGAGFMVDWDYNLEGDYYDGWFELHWI